MGQVELEVKDGIATVALNRPEALNALASSLLDELELVIAEVARREDVRAVILTGRGRAFAAGADVAEIARLDSDSGLEFARRGQTIFNQIESLEKPVVAAVNGFALGGGCELACACDWIYASTKAVFGQPEVKLGLIPGFGGTTRVTRRVGLAWAKEIILGGQNLSAEEALRIGLANRLFESGELLEKAIETGEAIAGNGPLAVAASKRVLQQGQDADARVASALEQAAFGGLFATRDRDEGLAAFLEKRDPKFEGR